MRCAGRLARIVDHDGYGRDISTTPSEIIPSVSGTVHRPPRIVNCTRLGTPERRLPQREFIGIDMESGKQEFISGAVNGERRPLYLHPIEITPGGYWASRIL